MTKEKLDELVNDFVRPLRPDNVIRDNLWAEVARLKGEKAELLKALQSVVRASNLIEYPDGTAVEGVEEAEALANMMQRVRAAIAKATRKDG